MEEPKQLDLWQVFRHYVWDIYIVFWHADCVKK